MGAAAWLTLWGNAALFDAVAVNGTAAMFLTPVLVAGLILRLKVPLWSYLAAFALAVGGAAAYFLRDLPRVAALLPQVHKYHQLQVICLVALVTGFCVVGAGIWQRTRLAQAPRRC